jgi:hypothetical protein
MGASNAAAESGQTMHFTAEIDGYLTEVVGKSARCCLGIVLGRRLMTDIEVHEGIQGNPNLRWWSEKLMIWLWEMMLTLTLAGGKIESCR